MTSDTVSLTEGELTAWNSAVDSVIGVLKRTADAITMAPGSFHAGANSVLRVVAEEAEGCKLVPADDSEPRQMVGPFPLLTEEQRQAALSYDGPEGHGDLAYRDDRATAKAQGYTGDECSECGNFTMVRNGTCLKCQTCGSTTGCS